MKRMKPTIREICYFVYHKQKFSSFDSFDDNTNVKAVDVTAWRVGRYSPIP